MPPKEKKAPRKRKAAPKKTSAKKVAHFRSKVGNGVTLFLDGSLDQRSLAARRFRELTYSFGSDLGGFESLSEFQKQLTRRSAALSVLCEIDECRLAKGEEIDAGRFNGNVNTLNRLGQTLGVQRVVLDVTPTLEAYILAKRKEKARRPPEVYEDEDEEGGDDADGE